MDRIKKNIILFVTGLVGLLVFYYLQAFSEGDIIHLGCDAISKVLGIDQIITDDLVLFLLWDYIIAVLTSLLIYKLLIRVFKTKKLKQESE